jgi:hypothetical protein
MAAPSSSDSSSSSSGGCSSSSNSSNSDIAPYRILPWNGLTRCVLKSKKVHVADILQKLLFPSSSSSPPPASATTTTTIEPHDEEYSQEKAENGVESAAEMNSTIDEHEPPSSFNDKQQNLMNQQCSTNSNP